MTDAFCLDSKGLVDGGSLTRWRRKRGVVLSGRGVRRTSQTTFSWAPLELNA